MYCRTSGKHKSIRMVKFHTCYFEEFKSFAFKNVDQNHTNNNNNRIPRYWNHPQHLSCKSLYCRRVFAPTIKVFQFLYTKKRFYENKIWTQFWEVLGKLFTLHTYAKYSLHKFEFSINKPSHKMNSFKWCNLTMLKQN